MGSEHSPEKLGRYSKAKGYAVPIYNPGFVLWKVYDPLGEELCTLAVKKEEEVDKLVNELNTLLGKA